VSHTETRMPTERLRAIQDRRRSGAAGKHTDRRQRRQHTRSAQKGRAIAEYR